MSDGLKIELLFLLTFEELKKNTATNRVNDWLFNDVIALSITIRLLIKTPNYTINRRH